MVVLLRIPHKYLAARAENLKGWGKADHFVIINSVLPSGLRSSSESRSLSDQPSQEKDPAKMIDAKPCSNMVSCSLYPCKSREGTSIIVSSLGNRSSDDIP